MIDIRTTVPSGRITRRTIISTWAKTLLEEALWLNPETAGPDNPLLFDKVGFGTLDDIPPRAAPAAMLQEGEEEITEGMNMKTTKNYRLYVHFKVIKTQGLDQQDLINYYFGRVIQTLVTPEDFAGHVAMDVTEVGNAIVADGQNDPEPGGTIWFDVEYRHTYGNPFAE